MKTFGRNPTGANRGNGEGILCSLRSLLFKSGSRGVVELDFDKSISDGVNIYAKRDGDADFVFLALHRQLRLPALHSLGDGGREYKAIRILADAEIGLFSDEIVVNCAP